MAKSDAPGLRWKECEARWRCSRRAAKEGYPIKSQRLWCSDTGQDPDMQHIADECLRLDREMREWLKDRRGKLKGSLRRKGTVYFVRAGDRVKIGFTANLPVRLRRLRAGSSEPIELVRTIETTADRERLLHDRYRRYREHGEWFRLEGSLAAYLMSAEQTGTSTAHNGAQASPSP